MAESECGSTSDPPSHVFDHCFLIAKCKIYCNLVWILEEINKIIGKIFKLNIFLSGSTRSAGLIFWGCFCSTLATSCKDLTIGKDSDAGRDWGQEEKGMTEDEMAGWHHRLDGRGFEWTPGDGDGQGGLTRCNSWGRKDWATELNWTELLLCHSYPAKS